MSMDDQGDDEGVNDGNHEVLGRDKLIRQFPKKWIKLHFRNLKCEGPGKRVINESR